MDVREGLLFVQGSALEELYAGPPFRVDEALQDRCKGQLTPRRWRHGEREGQVGNVRKWVRRIDRQWRDHGKDLRLEIGVEVFAFAQRQVFVTRVNLDALLGKRWQDIVHQTA